MTTLAEMNELMFQYNNTLQLADAQGFFDPFPSIKNRVVFYVIQATPDFRAPAVIGAPFYHTRCASDVLFSSSLLFSNEAHHSLLDTLVPTPMLPTGYADDQGCRLCNYVGNALSADICALAPALLERGDENLNARDLNTYNMMDFFMATNMMVWRHHH
jgi:hypothetical protein